MLYFLVITGLLTLVYSVVLILLVRRARTPFILKRSPGILSICLIANYLNSLVYISDIFDVDESSDSFSRRCSFFYSARQSINILSSFLGFLCYILRAYRIYFIFKLDSTWNSTHSYFRKYIHRARQAWLLKVLALGMIPALIVAVVIFCSCESSDYIISSNNEETRKEFIQPEYLFLTFVQELVFIFSINLLRNVNDDFNMTKELFWVGLLWYLRTLFSIVPNHLEEFRYVTMVLKNLGLLYISYIYPLFCSYYTNKTTEIITIEMLGSLELMLQCRFTLEYFEKFLIEIEGKMNQSKDKETPFMLLSLYMKCENFLNKPESVDQAAFIQEIQGFTQSDLNEGLYLKVLKTKIQVLKELESEYFSMYLNSRIYAKLQRTVYKREIYVGRLMEVGMNIVK